MLSNHKFCFWVWLGWGMEELGSGPTPLSLKEMQDHSLLWKISCIAQTAQCSIPELSKPEKPDLCFYK